MRMRVREIEQGPTTCETSSTDWKLEAVRKVIPNKKLFYYLFKIEI